MNKVKNFETLHMIIIEYINLVCKSQIFIELLN